MKKIDSENIRNKRLTLRFSKNEFETIKNKLKATNQKPSIYCREIAVNGFVFEKNNSFNLNEVRLLRQTLMEYKTHFSRISNLISVSSPLLFKEIETTIDLIKLTLKKYEL